MKQTPIYEKLTAFHLPAWNEIPEVGLYLDQVVKFVNLYLEQYPNMAVTGSMISNYVKLKVTGKAEKKAYGRPLIAHILFVAVARTVMSLDQLRAVREIIEEQSDMKSWYETFCRDMEKCLRNLADHKAEATAASGGEQELLHNIAVTVAHKMYLDQYFAQKQLQKEPEAAKQES